MAKNIDQSNLKQIIRDFPEQFAQGIEIAKNIKVKGKFDQVIICGMGGSALAGDILADYLNSLDRSRSSTPDLRRNRQTKARRNILVDRTYQLPLGTDKKSLIFISSYSGDTEEELAEYREARRKRLTVVSFCSEGELKRLCQKNKTPLIKFPKGLPARYSLGLAFSGMATILGNSGFMRDKSKEILALSQYLKRLNRSKVNPEKEGEKLAKELINRIPLIYASDQYKALAYNWKIKFNENSKIMAFFNVFPELNHNEITGYNFENINGQKSKIKDQFYFIILKSPDDHPRILKRMDLTTKMIKEKGGKVTILTLVGRNFLERTFSGLVLGDWVSYHLALMYGVDPTGVEAIEKFKARLKIKNGPK